MVHALLPAAWYSDERIFELEQKLLREGPQYVGHELMVPEVGDYHSLGWENHARFLIRSHSGIELLTNACRHRQATLVEGSGNVKAVVCPFHRWTYDLGGTLLGAPHFPTNPCKNLFRSALESWNGLLFTGDASSLKSELAAWGPGSVFDLSGHVLDKTLVVECQQNWKTFIEVYLDLYHVAPLHPGLGALVSCTDPDWTMGETFSTQTVRTRPGRSGTPLFEAWQEQLGSLPEQGAVWLLRYPTLMVEWYPGDAIMVSVLIPRSPTHTTNVIHFFYPRGTSASVREAHQAAMAETMNEDEALGRSMDQGRAGLVAQGLDDMGPIQLPMEAGIEHFHRWLLSKLGPTPVL